jgi:hypothetical protein
VSGVLSSSSYNFALGSAVGAVGGVILSSVLVVTGADMGLEPNLMEECCIKQGSYVSDVGEALQGA